MILTYEQVSQRIDSSDNIINKLKKSRESQVQSKIPEIIIKDGINNHIGHPGSVHLSENERVAIGVLGHHVDHETVADIFGISKGHVSELKNGNRTTGIRTGTEVESFRTQDNNLLAKIEERLNKTKLSIQERAAETLLTSLGLMTPDKLENSSAKELAQVTSQMSQVMRNLKSEGSTQSSGIKVQIVLHQPKQAREESFDFIEVSGL
jgi:hypothetical protein